MRHGTLIVGDCTEIMRDMESESIDLTVTSPPYDNMRNYQGYTFNFVQIGEELYRVTKDGGVVVWVVGDKVVKGNRTLTSFQHGLHFQHVGFNMHDVMIYQKKNTPFYEIQCVHKFIRVYVCTF